MTLDNASVPSIGRHAATGRVAGLTSNGSSVGCGQEEKAVLRMIAAESAIFVTLDIVLSPSFVRRRCDGECSSDDP